MSIISAGEHLIHFEALGRGEPLIFIHGWLGSWRYWWSSMQELSKYYRAFAFDLWGFGDSSKVSQQYQFEAYVKMLGAFIDGMGIVPPVTLVGHSLGAAVAVRYARLRPQQVKRLVAVSLPVQGESINSRLASSDNDGLSRFLGRSSNYPEVEAELRKTDVQALRNLARELATYDFAADLEGLQCPTLLVFGDDDTVIAKPNGSHARFLRSEGNRAAVSLASCTHFPMLEETAKFNRLLLEFAHSNNHNLAELTPKEYWQRRTH